MPSVDTPEKSVKQIKKEYYERNKEKFRERARLNYIKNRRERLEACKKWQKENKEKVKEIQKRYLENNKEKRKDVNKKNREINKEHKREKRNQWKSRNISRCAEYKKRHHARKLGAAICDFTHAQWIAMQAHYDHRCVYCGKRRKGHLTQDHISPLSKGGNHTASNIVPACRACNSKKHAGAVLCPIQPLLLPVS